MGYYAVKYTLDDGTTTTVVEMMKKTGMAQGTCYARLNASTDPAQVYRPLQHTRSGKSYTLDDGTVWTVDEVAEFLGCKRTSAGARLSSMNGESKRIFAKPRNDFSGENALDEMMLKERISKRMYEDSTGFWGIFNKMTGVVK
jgi:hypothetical protein